MTVDPSYLGTEVHAYIRAVHSIHYDESGMFINLKLLALFLVAFGALFLIQALVAARFLLNDEYGHPRAWQMLFGFVVLFIFGYAGYGGMLASRPVEAIDLVIAAVFFGGGLFVVLVVRMSVRTVQHVHHMRALERHHALHDSLTNLPNRRLMMERIEQAIASAQTRGTPLAILILDLNRFKEVNDTLGHHCGDQLLMALSPRLLSAISATDLVARLGGDEFGFVLENVTVDQASAICKRILEVVDQAFNIDGHGVSIGGSVGIAMYPEHGDELQLLLQHADVAMYEAKRHGQGYAVYEAAQDQYSLNRLRIVTSLRDRALFDQLDVHYQPKISLKDGEVCGLEALLRWQHPTLGEIDPDSFIPIAERAGVMRQITLWVLRHTIEQMQRWQDKGFALHVAVNLSVRNLGDENLPQDIQKILEAYSIPPSRITLEVTESSMMVNPRLAQEILNKLNALGLLSSIDDFGSGYSSLAYLKSLPATEIKIDKSFVLNMTHDESDAVIVHSTIALAHNMGYRVVAEGVETAEIFELLQVLGCDVVQGFYLSRAMPAEQVLSWVQQHNQNHLRYARAL